MNLSQLTSKTSFALLFVLFTAFGCGQSTSLSASHGAGDPAPAPAAHPSPSPSAPAGPPTRLQIPSIKVDASIEAKGLDNLGRISRPDDDKLNDVVWYKGSSIPGQDGNAVFSGHYNWINAPRLVFYYLNTLHKGDQIIVIRSDGAKLTYLVEWVRSYPYDSTPPGVFDHSGPSSLAVITCDGDSQYTTSLQDGIYLKRIVVMAYPAPPSIEDAPPVAG